MKLDTTSLGNAVERLRDGLLRHQREPKDEQVPFPRIVAAERVALNDSAS
jgi:hypothetical protein